MRILLLSDTHGSTSWMSLLDIYKGYQVIHCGDYGIKEDKLPSSIIYVGGNCDWHRKESEKLITIDGKLVFITHGDAYGVKRGIMNLDYRVQELKADYCFFGHTHFPMAEKIGDAIFVNPGSYKYQRSYAIIEDNKVCLVRESEIEEKTF